MPGFVERSTALYSYFWLRPFRELRTCCVFGVALTFKIVVLAPPAIVQLVIFVSASAGTVSVLIGALFVTIAELVGDPLLVDLCL